MDEERSTEVKGLAKDKPLSEVAELGSNPKMLGPQLIPH